MHLAWTLAVSALVVGFGVVLLWRWLKGPQPEYRGEAVPGRESGRVFALALLFRVLVFLLATAVVCAALRQGFDLSVWKKWDAWHYVSLAELGYSGYVEDGQHLFVVFFPLYVWLVRLVGLAIPNTMAAGLVVSFLCYAGGCVYLYRLAALEYGRAVARRAVVLLSVFPYAFFFGGVMTEGLFLLTTAAGLYHIRRRQWLAAGLWGILAALTRMHGLLLIVAAGAELVSTRERGWWKKIPLVLLPVAGTLIYLGLNLRVTGDPFGFVKMQAHWSQGFCWISETLWYVLQNAVSFHSEAARLQIWVPTLLLFPVFFALLARTHRRHRSMFTLYAFAYLILNYSLSWLLSAGRYLSCGVPFFLFAAVAVDRRPVAARVLTAGLGALFALNLALYLTGGQIM